MRRKELTHPELSRRAEYSEIRIFTRDTSSDNCVLLSKLPKVTFAVGATDDEDALRAGLSGIDLVFCNVNSFAVGIKNEIYWGIRIFELCVQAGVKHFIWSSLDNYMFDVKYDESLRAGHYWGKAHVEQWLYSIPQREDSTRWSILTTGPYIEGFWERFCPKKDPTDDKTYLFQIPLKDGAIPFVHLEDLGPQVHWLFSNISQSAGLNLKVAVAHVSLPEIAAAFTKVTGKPARAENIPMDEYWKVGTFANLADKKLGYEPPGVEDKTLLTYRQNFTHWFQLYQRSGANKGILRRDYELLDKLFPNRVKSLEEWMRKVGYTGEYKPVLKSRGHAKAAGTQGAGHKM